MTLIATKVSNALSLQPHHFYHSSIIFSFGAQRPIYIFLSETSFRSMNVGGEANYGHNPTGFITGQFASVLALASASTAYLHLFIRHKV